MARMRPPKIDEKLIPVIPADELRKLLDICAGRSFEDRRDAAIIRMFIAIGARLAEIANLRLQEIDLDRTRGLGGRARAAELVLELSPKVVEAGDRYHSSWMRKARTAAESSLAGVS